MDTVHFDPEVNRAMCEAMAAGSSEVMAENLEDTFAATRTLMEQYEQEVIPELEANERFVYAEG